MSLKNRLFDIYRTQPSPLVRRGLRNISIISYLLSWFMPVLITKGGVLRGLDCGILGIICGVFIRHFEAFANLFYFAAIACFCRNRKATLFFASVAFVLALQTFTLPSVPIDRGGIDITGYGIGFYLWLLSFIAVLLGSWKDVKDSPVTPESKQIDS